jgi:adenosylhomocysteine nucleosidase
MKVLVTLAVEPEFAPWRRRHSFRRVAAEAIPVYEAQLGAAELTVALTGMGVLHAERAASILLSQRPEFCISGGLAGGLKREYRVGHVLAARAVWSARDRSLFRSAESLVELAIGCGAVPVEKFWTSEGLVQTAQEKSRLGVEADAVEMESAVVLAVAARSGVPAVAIRAVSDTVEMDLPYDVSRVLNARGQVSLPRALAQIAARPQRLPALVRLAWQSRRAAAALAEFLDRYVRALPAWTNREEAAWEEVAAT